MIQEKKHAFFKHWKSKYYRMRDLDIELKILVKVAYMCLTISIVAALLLFFLYTDDAEQPTQKVQFMSCIMSVSFFLCIVLALMSLNDEDNIKPYRDMNDKFLETFEKANILEDKQAIIKCYDDFLIINKFSLTVPCISKHFDYRQGFREMLGMFESIKDV